MWGHGELAKTLTQWLVSLQEEWNLDTETWGREPCEDGGRD